MGTRVISYQAHFDTVLDDLGRGRQLSTENHDLA
jgi:hypothetical protein